MQLRKRCDREQRCQNIGQNAEYASRDHCMDVMRQQASQTVGQCPKGVDAEDAKQCIGGDPEPRLRNPLRRVGNLGRLQVRRPVLELMPRSSGRARRRCKDTGACRLRSGKSGGQSTLPGRQTTGPVPASGAINGP